MRSFSVTIFFFAGLLFSFNGSASKFDWYDMVEILERTLEGHDCIGSQNCPEGWSSKVLVDYNVRDISADLLTGLMIRAEDEASTWMDTILEGDYDADGETSIDQVVELKQKSQIVAYFVTYSQKAWDLGSCDPYPEEWTDEWYDLPYEVRYKECHEGRIQESIWVTPKLDEQAIAYDYFASFD
jgi:hypothetical protein